MWVRSETRQPKTLWWHSGLLFLRILTGFFLIFTFYTFWMVNRWNNFDKEYITYVGGLRVLTQRIAKDAGEAILNASEVAFLSLRERTKEFSEIIKILEQGKEDERGNLILPETQAKKPKALLIQLISFWEDYKKQVNTILINQAAIIDSYRIYDKLNKSFDRVENTYDEIINKLTLNNASAENILELAQLDLHIAEVQTDLSKIMDLSKENKALEQDFKTRLKNYSQLFEKMRLKYQADADLYAKLVSIENEIGAVEEYQDQFITVLQKLYQGYAPWSEVYHGSSQFLELTTRLEDAYSKAYRDRFLSGPLTFILSAITLLLLLSSLYLVHEENKQNLKITEEENKALEDDIHKLVKELSRLGQGDLTISISKTEGVTAAIAEAVHYALNALRRLVWGINNTSKKVMDSSKLLKKLSQELMTASEHQATEILNTTGSVNSMLEAINQVTANAKTSSKVAQNSVSMAHEGFTVVQNTIAGMERIRDQIHETELRIQRLGESSEEIEEIVSLINGISEQTNILSLNAAIQAAMAGESGRGFAVVADEVQRLAEKSSHSTRDVENLVKSIQSDTQEAIDSMRHAIAEVISGTKLAHDAGFALEKIKEVSENLADLIQDISKTSSNQVEVSVKISKMMNIIGLIAKQTTAGTQETTISITELTTLISELQSSVAEFKLPEKHENDENNEIESEENEIK